MDDRSRLEETIALLDATLEATPDAIVVIDLNRRVVRCNRQFLNTFGLSPAELAAGGIDVFVQRAADQLDDPQAVRAIADDLATDPAARHTALLRLNDGRVLERYTAPLQIGSRILGRVATFRDATTAVRAAETLDQHRAFLEQAQAVAHIGSWVADFAGDGRVTWSPETYRIFGVGRDAFPGTFSSFYDYVHPDDRELVRAAGAATREHDRPLDIEHRIVRPDGTVRWVHECGSVVRDAQRRPVQIVGTVQDITTRRQLEDELRQAQKMEAIGRLAGGIAHDLNNSLTAIAGYTELALSELAREHPARADVDEIRRAAERASSVTRQLLAFSRKQLLEPRVFDLNETLGAISRLLSRLLGPDVRVETRFTDRPLPILGDPGQVEQAIINLAVNARDAMPTGGRFAIETAVESIDAEFARTHMPMVPGTYAVLNVSDTGHGMSRETQERIFEPFFTTKEAGKGTGLGLSMVYGTVKQIGGFIFVDSEVGRGTTFRIYLPPVSSAQPPQDQAARPADTPAAAREERGHGRETILIVEDEPAVRNLVASALRNDGYQLLLAASAEEALAIVEARPGRIDLLLTDAIMPGKSGIELAALMSERQPGLPVIIMSGYTEETLSISAAGGAIVLLQKPFVPRDLRRRIREVLDR